MQAADSLHKFGLQLVGKAANQDFPKPRVPVLSMEVHLPAGWDPHDVWRRMIKEPRERRLNKDF